MEQMTGKLIFSEIRDYLMIYRNSQIVLCINQMSKLGFQGININFQLNVQFLHFNY